MDSVNKDLQRIIEVRLKTAAMDRMRAVMEDKKQQDAAMRVAEAMAEHKKAAEKAAQMQQQTASVPLLDVCKLFVDEALTSLRLNHYKGEKLPDTDSIDLAVEREAVKELSTKVTTAISLGLNDFSYLSPMCDQLSLAFNRAGIAMTKPPEKRSKETRSAGYDRLLERETRRPLNDAETREIYNQILVATGLALKSIDEKLQGQAVNKKRFEPQIPDPTPRPAKSATP